ncbi:hypothetical protein Rsub_07354 [Raphidocelis subcapitata]|uniref:Uncharacterized protein n=1 Tax=Raphidocelis subcapitata TaxID=307507 RepID=A0A2V0P2K4_9CHLO|nr:hypothetical protein Rsub_07354 [Raphidocelis subcapitata]|eukprot:GBF94086.1 hypothetical protein Rsub_07354 [Raphidocelis subcapitata]
MELAAMHMKPLDVEPTNSGVSSGTAAATGGAAAVTPGATSGRAYARQWLYSLVMFPSYFTPCHGCTLGNRTPKREQLLTLFDTQSAGSVYCSHCPEFKTRGPWLLQVRRSAFKDVVKASDIARFGCDIGGIQQYTLNGSKVLYLAREAAPDRKATPTAAAPATCAVDGRAMMDKSSQYCSLKCKMHGEDPEFNEWLDAQDPSVKEAAYAAVSAPPRPTAACKRAAPNGCPYSYGSAAASSGSASPASSGGSGGAAAAAGGGAASGSSARSRKAPRNGATEAASPGSAAAAAAKPPAKLPAPLTLKGAAKPAAALARAASAPAAPGARAAASAAQHSAFIAAATDGPVLGGDWLGACPLEHALSCSAEWPSGLSVDAAGAAAWSGAPCDAADHLAAADWWLAGGGDAAGAGAAAGGGSGAASTATACAGAAPHCCSGGAAAAGDDDDHGALLVEWPAGGAPLASGETELLPYGAASPASDCAVEASALLW